MGRRAVALPQVPSAGWHSAVLLQAQPMVSTVHVTRHSSAVGRAQSALKSAPDDCNAQTQHIQKQNKTSQMLAIINLGFWEMRVKKKVLHSL